MSLFVVYGDEEVAASYTRLAQHRKGGGVALDGNQVSQTAQLAQRLGVLINHSDVVTITTQHTRQVATHLAYSRNYNFHYILYYFSAVPKCSSADVVNRLSK